MKTNIAQRKTAPRGSAMILALIFVTVTLIILAGALGWATTSTRLTGRNVEYFRTEAAAEAATEKVVASIATITTNKVTSMCSRAWIATAK